MELKSLILGVFLSIGVFALKSGGGLAYVFLQMPGRTKRILTSLLFMTGYGIVFGMVALILLNVDLMTHSDKLQAFFKSGMTLHFFLAILLLLWGSILLKKSHGQQQTTRGWILLVIPCPVCFTVILLSCSFIYAVYPGNPLVFFSLYAGYILISLIVATVAARLIQNQEAAEHLLGMLMIYIAVYFIISVIAVPQFADLDKIYRISTSESFFEISQGNIILFILIITAFTAGYFNPFKKE